MDPATEDWFARRTWQTPGWSVEELVAVKRGRRVSVVLPALDEEATVGAIVAAIVPLSTGPTPLVDELVVLDSGSTDRTVERAAAAGARVVRREEVLPGLRARARQGRGAVALARRHHRRRDLLPRLRPRRLRPRRSCRRCWARCWSSRGSGW